MLKIVLTYFIVIMLLVQYLFYHSFQLTLIEFIFPEDDFFFYLFMYLLGYLNIFFGEMHV